MPTSRFPPSPAQPDEATRRLRAELILEEALETIYALGFEVDTDFEGPDRLKLHGHCPTILKDVIDGCCDTIYVCIGTMLSCGVPDLPHLAEVCEANDRKFPGGQATFSPSGKFLKPPGWIGPDHAKVIKETNGLNLRVAQEIILRHRGGR